MRLKEKEIRTKGVGAYRKEVQSNPGRFKNVEAWEDDAEDDDMPSICHPHSLLPKQK